MKKLITVAATVLLMACGTLLANQDEGTEKEPSVWMKRKLTYSQNILNGLVAEDYDLLIRNSTAMKGLNRVEYFVRRKPEGYRTQLRVFQLSLDDLLRHSQDQNLDGATLAFTQMTMSCVNCHKQLRSE